MTAADAREELEAAFWRHWPVHRNDFRTKSDAAIAAVLAAADAYAKAAAGERIARMTSDQLARLAEIRRRGEQATAEAAGRRTS